MRIQIKGNRGFTLIEVLISVLILGLGILGVLNLQTRALMDNQDAYLRTQAIFLAYDMSDRIRANSEIWNSAIKNSAILNNLIVNAKTGKKTGIYHFCSIYDPDPTGTLQDCKPTEMAQYDVYRWKRDIDARLKGTATIKAVPSSFTTDPSNASLQLKISWGRVNQDLKERFKKFKKASELASYTLEVRI